MSIVQISKIQVRRGQKNSNSGIPQLSSAEFAWAVDTQELFIGNGSVLEGAPYVGNTKILTEHDNILDLASSYQFASNDTAITLSVSRNLQSKLDEYVSVTDFGAIGDGSTDCVQAFQTAVTQLFRNANTNYRKILLIPNGEYLFTSGLALPDGVILQGETQLGVVLNMGANNIRFVTRDGEEVAEFDSTNRPQNVKISNLTIKRTTGQTVLTGVANSEIENVKFLGEYDFGDGVTISTAPSAVFWENNLAGIKVDNIKFKNCLFEANGIAIKANQTAVFDTNVKFENCKFFISDTAIYVIGVATQETNWQVYDCDFEEIANQAFRSTNGRGTLIQRSKFKKVGNTNNLSSIPNDYMVFFGERVGNIVVDCISDRQQLAGITSSNLITSYSEVYNSDLTKFLDRNFSTISPTDSFLPLAVFSAMNKFTIINYCLRLGAHIRHGQLWIAIGEDIAGTELDNPPGPLNGPGNVSEVTITDNFQYSPRFLTSEGGFLMTNFEFAVELRDNDADSGIETIVLSYKNPLPGATGSISFDVAYGV